MKFTKGKKYQLKTRNKKDSRALKMLGIDTLMRLIYKIDSHEKTRTSQVRLQHSYKGCRGYSTDQTTWRM